MEGSESSRSRSKRVVEDSVDARGSWKEEEEREDADGRKNRSGKLRKHSYADEVEEPDDGRRRTKADRNEPRRKSVTSSSRAYSGDEDDYNVRRESGVSNVPRRSPEERIERRSSDGYKDRDGDSGRRRREDENDWDSSRSSSRTSGHDVSHSKSRSKTDGPYDVQYERQQEKDTRSSEGRESSRDKQGHRDQEEKSYQRRVDEAYTNRRADGTGSDRADTRDGRSSSDQSRHRNVREAHDDRNEFGEIWEDTEKRKGSDRIEKNDQDRRSVDPWCDTGSCMARDREDKHGRVEEKPAGSVDDIGQTTSNHSAKPEENNDKLRHQEERTHENNDNVETKDKLPCLDEDGCALLRDGSDKEARHDKYHREKDGGDRGHPDSDNERSISMEKTKEDLSGLKTTVLDSLCILD